MNKDLREALRINLRAYQEFLDNGMPNGDSFVIKAANLFISIDFDSDGYAKAESGLGLNVSPLNATAFSSEDEANHYAVMINNNAGTVVPLSMAVAECKEASLNAFEESA